MYRAVLIAFLLALTACTPPTPKKEIVGLRTFQYQGGDVRSGSVDYPGSPPAGGPYNAMWQTCGAYTAPIYDEYAVHTLARGAVWATYRPGLPAAELTTLAAVLKTPIEVTVPQPEGSQQKPAPKKTVTALSLLSPRENLPAPIVLTVWNAQVSAQSADDENLKLFVETYGLAQDAPESGAGCAGGFDGTR